MWKALTTEAKRERATKTKDFMIRREDAEVTGREW